MKYQIWIEGYKATGGEQKAQFCGEYEADSFADACESHANEFDSTLFFNKENLTIWGCRLFDNEQDARKSFG